VEISIDGETWQTLSAVPASDDWLKLTIDLSPHAGRLIRVRFVFDPGAVGAADEKRWQIRNVTLIPSIPLRR
jgi:hypothetical protein